MIYIGFEREEEAEIWARKKLGADKPSFFRAFSAVDKAGKFLCVVIMTNFSSRNVDMNIVIDEKSKMRPKETIRMFNGIFKYIFDQLRLIRVTGLLRGKNEASKFLCKHLGFKLEGIMRKSFGDDDLHIYGFLADDFRSHAWYRG